MAFINFGMVPRQDTPVEAMAQGLSRGLDVFNTLEIQKNSPEYKIAQARLRAMEDEQSWMKSKEPYMQDIIRGLPPAMVAPTEALNRMGLSAEAMQYPRGGLARRQAEQGLELGQENILGARQQRTQNELAFPIDLETKKFHNKVLEFQSNPARMEKAWSIDQIMKEWQVANEADKQRQFNETLKVHQAQVRASQAGNAATLQHYKNIENQQRLEYKRFQIADDTKKSEFLLGRWDANLKNFDQQMRTNSKAAKEALDRYTFGADTLFSGISETKKGSEPATPIPANTAMTIAKSYANMYSNAHYSKAKPEWIAELKAKAEYWTKKLMNDFPSAYPTYNKWWFESGQKNPNLTVDSFWQEFGSGAVRGAEFAPIGGPAITPIPFGER